MHIENRFVLHCQTVFRKLITFAHSFRGKLVLIQILVTLLPIMIVAISTFYGVRQVIFDKFSSTMEQSVYQTTVNIDLILNDVRNTSNGIMANERLTALMEKSYVYDASEIEDLLRTFYAASDYIEGLSVFRSDYAFSVGYERLTPINQIASWVNQVDAGQGEIRWLGTRSEWVKSIAGGDEHRFFSLTRRLVNLDTSRSLGLLLIDVDENLLSDTLLALHANTPGISFICDDQGVIISHTEKTRIGTSVQLDGVLGEIFSAPSNRGRLTYEPTLAQKDQNPILLDDSIIIYSTCQVTGWHLISMVPLSYLYQDINSITSWILVALILLLALSLFFFLMVLHRQTRPILTLTNGMLEVEKGNLSVQLESQSNDEIGHMTHTFNSMTREIQGLLSRIVLEEKQKQQIELEAMRAQINPHFLYNTLNSIRWMAKIQGADNIGKAIMALTKLLRVSINLTTDMISLHDEIEYVNNYVYIMKMRFNELVDIQYDVPEYLEGLKVQKLILQPIVENAFVHGIQENVRLKLEIAARLENGDLLLTIKDNGRGIEADRLETLLAPKSVSKMSSVGIANVNNRIQMHSGKAYGLQIDSVVDQGTTVTIRLPAIKGPPPPDDLIA